MKVTAVFFLFFTSIVFVGCPAKQTEVLSDQKNQINTEVKIEKKPVFSKVMRESFYFAASLEREALKLVSHNSSFADATLFSVLSYAIESESGIKRPLSFSDCSRFKVDMNNQVNSVQKELKFFKICQVPHTLLATMTVNDAETQFNVHFYIKDWPAIVGLSVSLTNPDVECELKVKEKKLNSMNCENLAYVLTVNSKEKTEARLKTFTFQRENNLQLKLVGGFYRDLIERKKIEVTVPLQGKIKVIEKEIAVKDDFADKENLKEVENAKKEIEYKKSLEESSQPIKEQSQQGDQQAQEQSQDPTQGAIDEQKTEPIENQPKAEEVEQDQNNGGVPKISQPRSR